MATSFPPLGELKKTLDLTQSYGPKIEENRYFASRAEYQNSKTNHNFGFKEDSLPNPRLLI